LYGITIALPVMFAGYAWAKYAGSKIKHDVVTADDIEEESTLPAPSVLMAFLPVIVPIVLIAVKSFLAIDATAAAGWMKIFTTLGDPVTALLTGVVLALFAGKKWTKQQLGSLLQEGAEKAGGILVIIGAGGGFGAILAATKIGEHFSAVVPLASIGLLFPFLLTFVLKTAQGSSTVAIITAASIVKPLLIPMGLDTDNGRLLCVLAMGAGSMLISHANDAYFWVITKFSGLEMKTMLRVYSLATLVMGITAMAAVYILSLLLH